MTPTEKVKQKLVHMVTGETVTDVVELQRRLSELAEDDSLHDAERKLRSSGVPTGLPCEYSRHYSSQAVAAEMLDGSWVGWTYWYGGGKHGEPGAIEWVDDAYDVDVTVVTEPVHKFTKREPT